MKIIKEGMTFSEILDELKSGMCVRRAAWHCNKFIVKQNDADIPNSVVPNMQSLPQEAKKLIRTKNLEYRNQCLMCTILDTTIKATNYVPNWNDIFADDWMVVENEF
jgi:hypothetical protein